MFSLIVKLFLVQLCVNSASSLSIDTNLTSENYDPKQNFSINEYEDLNIRVNHLNKKITTDCTGSCRVYNNSVNLSCKVVQQQKTFLNVTMAKRITKELNGKWECTYIVTERYINASLNTKINLNSNFVLQVMSNGVLGTVTWGYICFGIIVLIVLLIIIIQTGCILHYKKKAKKLCREANWSNTTENTADTKQTVRYSTMPGLKKKEVLFPESRESAIYEVLENIRVAPDPPPVESLPRKKTALKSSPITSDPPSSSTWRAINSLLRRKNKNEDGSGTGDQEQFLTQRGRNSKTSTLDKRSTLDHIKERPPLPIPAEEVYEAVESPPPVRKETKPKVIKEISVPKVEIRAFTQSKPKVELPVSAITNVATPFNSQLKQAVEKGVRLNPVPPPILSKSPVIPKETRRNATQPPIPKQKLWTNEPQLPNATIPKQKTWQNETIIPKQKVWPNETTIPKQKLSPNEPPMPKEKPSLFKAKVPTKPVLPSPQEKEIHEEPPGPTGSLRSRVKPFNPGLPPRDASPVKTKTPWGEVMPPKPKPPPPTKPKQLHPLPHTPREPEPIHVVTEYADDEDPGSDEDWVYEQLPDYNIYSI